MLPRKERQRFDVRGWSRGSKGRVFVFRSVRGSLSNHGPRGLDLSTQEIPKPVFAFLTILQKAATRS